MKLTKDEIIEACKYCTTDTCSNKCPLYDVEGECIDILLKNIKQAIPDSNVSDVFDHEWEYEPLSKQAMDMVVEDWFEDSAEEDKPEIAPTRTPFIERDHILDDLEDAKDKLQSIEKAWEEAQDFAIDVGNDYTDTYGEEIRKLIDEYKDLQTLLDRRYGVLENTEDFRNLIENSRHEYEGAYELLKVLEDRDKTMQILIDAYDYAKSCYEEDKVKAESEINLIKTKLATWDQFHDAKTGEVIQLDDNELNEIKEDTKELLYELFNTDKENFTKDWKKMNDEIPFVDALKCIGSSEEVLDGAEDVNDLQSLIDWLFK